MFLQVRWPNRQHHQNSRS